MDIVIDFDGTCVTHEFPLVGKDIGAIPVLKKLVENGHNLILFTMRSDLQFKQIYPLINQQILNVQGKHLSAAINWFLQNKIPLYGVQTNPTQNTWTNSPKAYGQLIIDDAALGCPLKFNSQISENPFVDWQKVNDLLIEMGIIES